MFDEMVFGRYVAEDSFVHRMDPRVKTVLSLAYMVAVFCAGDAAGLGLCALFIVAAYAAARIPPTSALRALGPLLILVAVSMAFNVLFARGGEVYFEFGVICITSHGLKSALFAGFRLLLLLFGMSLLTLTTTTLDITAAFEKLFSPLRKLHVPVHEMCMILGIALRFLPQFMRELGIIRKAQISRGADFGRHPLRGGLSGMTSLLVPLFTSAFRHADTLAWAMDARCYHGAVGRTTLTPLAVGWRDGVGAVWACVLLAAVIALRFV